MKRELSMTGREITSKTNELQRGSGSMASMNLASANSDFEVHLFVVLGSAL